MTKYLYIYIYNHYSSFYCIDISRFSVKYGSHVFSFPLPTVVSVWLPIKSQGGNDSQVTFKHGLNELPYKVVIDVKINSDGTDYIFHAIGSASSDDDLNIAYGGVIFLYDEVNVIAMAPNVNNDNPSGVSIYTGKAPQSPPPHHVNTITTTP